ncbi:hypothetical protein L1049_010256 [Liquidambar formosana]|uniref:Uncharacterized protein n=1 Tax=Liquidambar formosana TaxID=63359 RepID=A0AAP0N7C2_LIQFO
MMKWGRKKPSSSPPSRLPSLSHAFPISWFSKFKQKSGTSEAEQTKVKPKGKQNLPPRHGSCKDGRFYGGDDDAYWRISFGEGSVDGRKSEGVLQSVWYDSDDEVEILPSSCRSCISAASKVSGGEETRKFSDMVSGMGKMRDLPGNMEDLPKFGTCRGQKESKETELQNSEERSCQRLEI